MGQCVARCQYRYPCYRHLPYGSITDAAIAVRDGKICWLGKQSDLPTDFTQHTRQIHDCKQQWLTPGLIDCHTHIVYAGNRAQEFEQRLQGVDYQTIAKAGGGIQATVNATRQADETTLLDTSGKRLQRLISEGVTTVEIKSGYGLDLDNECKMLRCARRLGEILPVNVRTSFLGAHALPKEMQGDADRYIDEVCNIMLPCIKAEGLADAVDGFCESIAFNPAQIRRVFSQATALGLALKLHADQLSDLQGAQLAADFNALSADHLEYTNATGVQALAASGTVAVLLPGAFYYLREQVRHEVAQLKSMITW